MTLHSTSNNSNALAIHYDNIFLERFKNATIIDKWADKKTIPLWRGKTVDYFAYYPIAGDTTAITEGSSTANEVAATGQTVQATVAKYAQWLPVSEMIKLTARDKNVEGLSGLLGEAAAESLEKILVKELFLRGSIPIRVDQLDNSSTNTWEGTANAGSSTTKFTATGCPASADETYTGAHLASIHTATNNYRYGSDVTNYTGTGDIFTMTTAAPITFTSGFKFRVVNTTGMTAANIIVQSAIEFAVSKARENKFYTYPGGWLKSAIPSQVEYDLLKSTVWRNIGQYQQASLLEAWEIGKLWGCQFYRTNYPWRETAGTGGTPTWTAGIFGIPIMGVHSLANVSLEGMREHKILIKTPGPNSTNEPIDERSTVGYKFYAAPKSLNAAFCIALYTGASGQ